MEQTERIKKMEKILDEAQKAVSDLNSALENYSKLQPRLEELAEYYQSPQWLQDFVDDSFGRIPKNVKRGVLSEDAVHNLLSSDAELRSKLMQLDLNF